MRLLREVSERRATDEEARRARCKAKKPKLHTVMWGCLSSNVDGGMASDSWEEDFRHEHL